MFFRKDHDEIYNIYRINVISESEENNNRDLSYSGEMDEEEFEKFDAKLGKAKLWLYKRNQYLVYANVLSSLKTVPCRAIVDKKTGAQQKIDTMAVDPLGNLLINPEFLESLPDGAVVAILVHETFHHLNDTFGRQGIRDMTRWNIATDFIMNRDILKDGLELPSEINGMKFCVPVEKNGKFFIEDKDSKGNKIELDITSKTCEQLYDDLDKQLPKNPNPPDNPQPDNNPPPPVKIQIGDPVTTKDGTAIGIFKGINPMNNKAIIENMTEQEIRDYVKKRRATI